MANAVPASWLPCQVLRRPQRGSVKLRVYSASVGLRSRSLDSKKNGRFSGYCSAKRVLPESYGTSSAT